MKYFCALALSAITLLSSCTANKAASVPVSELAGAIATAADIKNPRAESLNDRDVSERYGISPESFLDGVIIYDAQKKNADKVMVILAKNDDGLRKVERSVETEKVRLGDAVENDKSQNEKEIITKTKDRYVALIMSDKAKDGEKAFDQMLGENGR